jgi:N-methylhydantoinase A
MTMSDTGTVSSLSSAAIWSSVRIGVDVGGTFTDLVLIAASGQLHVTKVPSVSSDPGAGILRAIEQAATELALSSGDLLGACELFVHGSTVATNTVLERQGARVGLLCTPGFRDTLEIRRGIRDDPWDHRTPFAPVIVPRYLRLPVAGRIDSKGEELEAVDAEGLSEALQHFSAQGIEAIAISLFNSYANPMHEVHYAQLIKQASVQSAESAQWLSVSHEIAPLMGEYERTSTTVLNAYIAPRTVGYLLSLDRQLRKLGLRQSMLLIQNNGGSISAAQVANKPATLLLSGPAAGVGALELVRDAVGSSNLLSLEIGGTSADVMLMEDGNVPIAEQLRVGGYDTVLPSVDIHTIGAGGGTIATVDAAGLLHVGPRGAGAIPGPAAYGLGGEVPTVTDALLVLGRLRAGLYAGGSVALDESLARQAIATHIAEPLSLSIEDAAVGIVRLLEQNLLQAVERMTLERGLDPSVFTLVPSGGAGPMHGASIGRRLGCQQLYIPRLSGAFCALGMLHVDVRHDLMRAFFYPLEDAHVQGMERTYLTLEQEAREMLLADGFSAAKSRLLREMDLRYIGQQWSIRISVDPGDELSAIRSKFEAVHQARFRHTQPDGIVEITAVHLVACGLIEKLQLPTIDRATDSASPHSQRRVYVDESHGWVQASVYAGAQLRAGHIIDGPAIIEEQTTTICIAPSDCAEVDTYGNYRVRLAY